jgi:hypothetical protein
MDANPKFGARALEEALRLYRGLGDQGGVTETLNEQGTLHQVNGDLACAHGHHQQPWNWPAPSELSRRSKSDDRAGQIHRKARLIAQHPQAHRTQHSFINWPPGHGDLARRALAG